MLRTLVLSAVMLWSAQSKAVVECTLYSDPESLAQTQQPQNLLAFQEAFFKDLFQEKYPDFQPIAQMSFRQFLQGLDTNQTQIMLITDDEDLQGVVWLFNPLQNVEAGDYLEVCLTSITHPNLYVMALNKIFEDGSGVETLRFTLSPQLLSFYEPYLEKFWVETEAFDRTVPRQNKSNTLNVKHFQITKNVFQSVVRAVDMSE